MIMNLPKDLDNCGKRKKCERSQCCDKRTIIRVPPNSTFNPVSYKVQNRTILIDGIIVDI